MSLSCALTFTVKNALQPAPGMADDPPVSRRVPGVTRRPARWRTAAAVKAAVMSPDPTRTTLRE